VVHLFSMTEMAFIFMNIVVNSRRLGRVVAPGPRAQSVSQGTGW
jgi:hypothetical protein